MLSAIALSHGSPRDLTDVTACSAASRSVSTIERCCTPRSEWCTSRVRSSSVRAPDRHLHRVEGQVGPQRGGDAPAHDAATEDVGDERGVRQARPGRHVGDVPRPTAGAPAGTSPPAAQTQAAHQPLDATARPDDPSTWQAGSTPSKVSVRLGRLPWPRRVAISGALALLGAMVPAVVGGPKVALDGHGAQGPSH